MTHKHLILSAAIFYVVIAPFFFHPDLKIIYSIASFLSIGVGNIYAHYSDFPKLFPLGPFVYPPAAYFFVGIFYVVANFLAGLGFKTWLGMGSTAVLVDHIYTYILVIKLPLIAVHILSGWLLTKIVPLKEKTLVAALWFFNPISIYIVGLMGQIDGLAVIWIILALLWAKNKPVWGAMSLAIGAGVKSFPLLLLPVFIILVTKNWRQRIVIGLAGVATYGFIVVGFLQTPGFYSQAFASGLSKSVLSAGIPVFLAIVTAFAFFRHSGQIQKLNNYFLIIALIVIGGVHFHPQWALWVLPMAAIYVAATRRFWWGALLVLGWVGNLFSFSDRFLTFGLLSPLNYSAFFLPPIVAPELIGKLLIVICLVTLTYDTVAK